MSTLHKTFIDGEIFTATDVNAALNPFQADHIPYAMAAGSVSCQAPSPVGYSYLTAVVFPGGRFTAIPVVTAGINGTGTGNKGFTCFAGEVTTAGFNIYVTAVLAQTDTYVPVAWIAVQMAKS